MTASLVERFHAASNRTKGQTVLEGFDEENRMYFVVLEKPVEKRGKRLLNAFLKDVPLEARRREAEKPLYIRRYE